MILFFTFSGLLNCIVSIFLGLLVYSKGKDKLENRSFALFCLGVAVWAGFYFLWLVLGTTKSTALFWGRALNIAAIFIPITYLYFITIFLNIYQKQKKLVLSGCLLAFLLLLSGFTSLFVKDVEPELSFLWYPKPGPTYHLFALMFFCFVVYSWYLMFNALKKRTGTIKLQIKYVLLGTFIGFIGGSSSFFLVYGVPISPFGNFLPAIGFSLIAFAILKYHLFEIRIILTELLVGAMAIILVVLPFLMPTFSLRILVAFIFFIFCVIGYLLVKATHKEIERREKIEKLSQELNKLNQTLEQKVKQRTKELEKAKRFAEVQREIAEERARRLEETHMRLLKKE